MIVVPSLTETDIISTRIPTEYDDKFDFVVLPIRLLPQQ